MPSFLHPAAWCREPKVVERIRQMELSICCLLHNIKLFYPQKSMSYSETMTSSILPLEPHDWAWLLSWTCKALPFLSIYFSVYQKHSLICQHYVLLRFHTLHTFLPPMQFNPIGCDHSHAFANEVIMLHSMWCYHGHLKSLRLLIIHVMRPETVTATNRNGCRKQHQLR